ncbi:hypothetical protein GCM10027187_07550 [Streptosporangium sandarakinum]|uniref:DUF8094 domain-containing protein n=1 Tax=Streptosporangium sandarakinum TaxID=1260955 RepID=A0A852V1N6_9ACTN|nr:hypothetical protein [Streptosporangium sandarakinum]NYF42060.1 hypothetical protein [Streptosporangium sandarakinum]
MVREAREALSVAVLAVILTGCGLVPPFSARPADTPAAASPSRPGTTPAPATTPAPTPEPSSGAPRLTPAAAKQAAASWVAAYNKMIKKRRWADDPDAMSRLLGEAALHEAVIDRAHLEEDKKRVRKPIRLTGRQTYYVPREQPPGGEWFMLQATYRGEDRPHILSFWREAGTPSFVLAGKSPLHYGERVPEPRRDSGGYVTAAPRTIGTLLALEYRTFWNSPKHTSPAGATGYRLAKDNYSRRAFPQVYKGLYAAYRSFTPAYGFVTRGGGSFYLFSLLNNPQGVTQVLTVGAFVPRGRKTIDEIAGDWYA